MIGPPTGSITASLDIVPTETAAISAIDPDDENDWRLNV